MQQVKISQISKIDLEQGQVTAIEMDFNEHEEIQEEFENFVRKVTGDEFYWEELEK